MTHEAGEPVVDDTLLCVVNAGAAGVHFTIPTCTRDLRWAAVPDTFAADREDRVFEAGTGYPLPDRSVAALRLLAPDH